MINKKDSENQTTLYIYIYKQKEYKVVKDKEAKKKNRCASRVVVVGSSNGLSRLLDV